MGTDEVSSEAILQVHCFYLKEWLPTAKSAHKSFCYCKNDASLLFEGSCGPVDSSAVDFPSDSNSFSAVYGQSCYNVILFLRKQL